MHEAGLAYEGVLAPTKSKLLPDGSDDRASNAKGDVPMLEPDKTWLMSGQVGAQVWDNFTAADGDLIGRPHAGSAANSAPSR